MCVCGCLTDEEQFFEPQTTVLESEPDLRAVAGAPKAGPQPSIYCACEMDIIVTQSTGEQFQVALINEFDQGLAESCAGPYLLYETISSSGNYVFPINTGDYENYRFRIGFRKLNPGGPPVGQVFYNIFCPNLPGPPPISNEAYLNVVNNDAWPGSVGQVTDANFESVPPKVWYDGTNPGQVPGFDVLEYF